MVKRYKFDLSATGGVGGGDTGFLDGELKQIRYVPTPVDTGQPGTLTMAVVPDEDDTGSGFVFYSEAIGNFGTAFTRYPRVVSTALPDTDTGTHVCVYGAGDKLRVDAVGGDTGVVVAGTLYAWVE